MRRLLVFAAILIAAIAPLSADLTGMFSGGLDHPAIAYAVPSAYNPASELDRRLRGGTVKLRFEHTTGYLGSVLDALAVPVESQIMVFSKTSLQQAIIGPQNPRAIYFNDSVVVAWVKDEPFVEIAASDPRQGVVFYTLNQQPADPPRLTRRNDCLSCHLAHASLGVPGMIMRSVFAFADGATRRELGDFVTDHRSPLAERWGGWFVTGKTGGIHHMGNIAGYTTVSPPQPGNHLSPYSDVVALLVFEHQMHMINLITRLGWEVRAAQHDRRAGTALLVEEGARELVDYLLFVDEPPLPDPVEGTSGFAEKFSAMGPRDSHGRALRQFDLTHRVMRYPCSYMIYSPAFDALPGDARDAIYRRLWQILSGGGDDAKYAALSRTAREAVIGILKETKPGLPEYFRTPGQ